METEEEGRLPFLDIDIYRKSDGSLGYKVYRKPTHTKLYLHHNSRHHPANKQSVLASLIHRDEALCGEDSFTQELEFLTTVFKDNGYSHQHIRRAMEPAIPTAKINDEPTSTAYISYTQKTYSRRSRMLAKHIKSIALSSRKIFSYFPPVRDVLGLRKPGVYRIPCECGRVYIAQSGRSTQLRFKEQNRHIRLAQHDKSAVAEHSFNHEDIIYRTQNSSLLKPVTWIDSSRKLLKLKCTHTVSTENIA